MAARAITGDIHVVEVCRQPADGGVAVVAIGAAWNMSWVFADGRSAIMTRTAGTQYLCVVNRYSGLKEDRAVAVFADIACLYVCHAFADRRSTIVAAHTIPGDA